MSNSTLKNRVVVVTGAGSGIGRAIALEVATRGIAALCLIGRDLRKLEQVAASVSPNVEASVFKTDLSLERDIDATADGILKAFGHADILVHGAGTIFLGPMDRSKIADFDRQYAVNVRAPYLLSQKLLPAIKAHQGQIVFINSSAGLVSKENVGQYAASKHALKAVSDSLRGELNSFGVRVLTVYPGQTATPMQKQLYEMSSKTYSPEKLVQPEDIASVVVHCLALPYTAEVTEIMIRPMMKP